MKINFNEPLLDFNNEQLIVDNVKLVDGIEKKVSETKLTLGIVCRQCLNYNNIEDKDTAETIYQKGKLIKQISTAMLNNEIIDLKSDDIVIIKKSVTNMVKVNGYSNLVAFQVFELIDK